MNSQPENDSPSPDPLSDFEPRQYDDPLEQALAETAVEAIENQPCLSVDAKTPIHEAVAQLGRAGVSSLLVTEGDRLIGIFTERDVLERVVECYDRICRDAVETVMTADPTIVYDSDPSAAAVAAISVAGHRHVPVLGMDEKVRGIVSPRRVFQFAESHC